MTVATADLLQDLYQRYGGIYVHYRTQEQVVVQDIVVIQDVPDDAPLFSRVGVLYFVLNRRSSIRYMRTLLNFTELIEGKPRFARLPLTTRAF